MKRIVRLTESDLTRIVKRVLNERGEEGKTMADFTECFKNSVVKKIPNACRPNGMVIDENPKNCVAELAKMLERAALSGDFMMATGIAELIECIGNKTNVAY